MLRESVPEAVRPYVHLGFAKTGHAGREWFGDCVFCGGRNKFYINIDTGQWQCKRGGCALEGNVYTLLQHYWETSRLEGAHAPWKRAEADRGLSRAIMEAHGLAWDGERWIIPVRGKTGSIINYRTWRIGSKEQGLPALDLAMWQGNLLWEPERATARIWLCEGCWDAMALEEILEAAARPKEREVVLGIPGSNVFKAAWADDILRSGRANRGGLLSREVVVAYDHDEAGRKGVARVARELGSMARVSWVRWPDEFPEGFDIRDFYIAEGTLEALEEIVVPWQPEETRADTSSGRRERNTGTGERMPLDPASDWPLLREGGRPTWEEVMEVYRQWLSMTPDMEVALRIIYAVIISNQMSGDPLWLHVVGPPGCGKTELLVSTVSCDAVMLVSTITPNTLVSGWSMKGGEDPSLIPRLRGKTAIFKDFTEVLKMHKQDREGIYSVLRGAFDGEVQKPYGNGVTRSYKDVHFSILSGVTQALFSEQSAIVGERFLVFHLLKGVGYDMTESLEAAMLNAGSEQEMKEALGDAAKRFLCWRIEDSDWPSLGRDYITRLVALAQLVSMLRGTVERTPEGDITYRPQHEVGTRLAKQLKKLLFGLTMLRGCPTEGVPVSVLEEDYELLVRVAHDTCIGFNLEILYALAEVEEADCKTLSEMCDIPETTVRRQLDDMRLLGILCQRRVPNPSGLGRNLHLFSRSPVVCTFWERASLGRGMEDARKVIPSIGEKLRRSRRTSFTRGSNVPGQRRQREQQ